MSLNATCAADVSDFCNTIISNPDILGIGVRAAAYVQTFLNMIVPSLMPSNLDITRVTARTTFILSIGIIISSIVQWKKGGLSLLDGILGTMLTAMMTTFATVNMKYISKLGLSLNLLIVLYLCLWTYWGFQVWLDPWTFGLQPSPDGPDAGISACTANAATKFVIVGKSIPATNNGLRLFALVVFGFNIISCLTAMGRMIKWLWRVVANRGETRTRIAEIRRLHLQDRYAINSGPGRTRLSGMGGLLALVYMIVTIEQMVRRNGMEEELSQLSFGQTLAVIMLLQQLFDIASWIKEQAAHNRAMIKEDIEMARTNRRRGPGSDTSSSFDLQLGL